MQKITELLLNETLEKLWSSIRERMNHNFHPTLDVPFNVKHLSIWAPVKGSTVVQGSIQHLLKQNGLEYNN